MKIEITACVNVVRSYDMIRVVVELPDDATLDDIRAEIAKEARYMRQDPEGYPGVMEMSFSHVEGAVSDINGGKLSDDDYNTVMDELHFSVGDDEARP